MSGNLRLVILSCLVWAALLVPGGVRGQAHEASQLILNYEKLAQLKEILAQMHDGYAILNKGYTRVKDIAEGNFRLHEAFLDALLQVSPEVRNYYRVAEIISYQQRILTEYRVTYRKVKGEGVFSGDELDYLGELYSGFFKLSLRNLDELALVMTAGELRMSDFERLEAIDRLHADMSALLVGLRGLNAEVSTLFIQRKRTRGQRNRLLDLNGLKDG